MLERPLFGFAFLGDYFFMNSPTPFHEKSILNCQRLWMMAFWLCFAQSPPPSQLR
mgnify:CR=1 FL=1